ncbi:hypothetical protein BJF93_13765 [Xaviernesmea oryzae]|uniref:Uncharacterized protein n=1 Tax=Xaviernesmea oryzae TaxID=464029 RepID=A0A1Q9AR40_9HYPH|nr:hypothetical protein BJF93_13765 [Xaviernesmea oryzae]
MDMRMLRRRVFTVGFEKPDRLFHTSNSRWKPCTTLLDIPGTERLLPASYIMMLRRNSATTI